MGHMNATTGTLSLDLEIEDVETFNAVTAAELIGKHPNTIRRWIYAGKLEARKSPGPYGRFSITRSALLQALRKFEPDNQGKAEA